MQFTPPEPGFTITFSATERSADAGAPEVPVRHFGARRRNRHGRGLRGPLIPANLPASRTRSENFDELVAESAERLRELWGATLEEVEYIIEEVPEQLEALIASRAQAPLGKYRRGPSEETGKMVAFVIIYRHPIEALCDAPWQVRELVHEVIIEQVAGLLNVDPDGIDPFFRRHRKR